jgi:hypothetical protein
MLLSNEFTSLPDCLGSCSALALLNVEHNALSSVLPSTLSFLSNLQLLGLSYNSMTASAYSLADIMRMTSLVRVELHDNPSLALNLSQWNSRALPVVQEVLLGNTPSFGTIDPDAFDCGSNSSLTQLDLSYMLLTPSPLPLLQGCTALQLLNLAGDGFVGTVPSTWTQSLTSVVEVQLQENSLTEARVLSTLPAIQFLNVSSNQLVTLNNDAGETVSLLVAVSLRELHAAHNLIEGHWHRGWFTTRSLQTIDVSSNQLKNLPEDLWEVIALVSADFSGCNLTGAMPAGVPSLTPVFSELTNGAAVNSVWQYFDVTNNPHLHAWPLPSWLAPVHPPSLFVSSDGLYQCLHIGNDVAKDFNVRVDPQFSRYRLCNCSRWYFGHPPLCEPIPALVDVGGYVSPTMAGVEATVLGRIIQPIKGQMDGNQTAAFGPAPPKLNLAQISEPCNVTTCTRAVFDANPMGISDSWYGSDRFTPGMSSDWILDLSSTFAPAANMLSNGTTDAVVLGSNLTTLDGLVPVRVLELKLLISQSLFTGSNVLTVSAMFGPTSQQQVMRIDAAAVLELDPFDLNATSFSNPSWAAAYGASIQDLPPPVVETSLTILSNQAVVSFESRDPLVNISSSPMLHSSSVLWPFPWMSPVGDAFLLRLPRALD